MVKLSKAKLAGFGKKIHAKAKQLRKADGDKLAYKEYVKKASAILKKQGAFE